MKKSTMRILCLGEALVDLITDSHVDSLEQAHHFTMYSGGAVSNVAMTVARLGGSATLVACVGNDALGASLSQQLQKAGVITEHLHTHPHISTSLAVITRNSTTPAFAVYRSADRLLTPTAISPALFSETSIFHTSAFALSSEPLSSTVLSCIKQAHDAQCMITLDPNYHPAIWNLSIDPATLIAQCCPYVTIIKPSLEDCIRLFGDGETPISYAQRFLDWGVQQVILTMGAKGVLLVTPDKTRLFPAQPVEVADVTGAGDAFWAGLMMALLDDYSLEQAIAVAQAVALRKLQHIGPLSYSIDRHALYKELSLSAS